MQCFVPRSELLNHHLNTTQMATHVTEMPPLLCHIVDVCWGAVIFFINCACAARRLLLIPAALLSSSQFPATISNEI